MAIDLATAKALVEHLASLHAATIHPPDGLLQQATRFALGALGAGVPMAKPVVDVAVGHVDRWSVTFPVLDTHTSAILLSPSHVIEPVRYAEVGTHEVWHGAIIQRDGWQWVADYLLSSELRAEREAGAVVVQRFVRLLLTGEDIPDVGEATRVLLAGAYHLQAGDGLFAQAQVASGLETMRNGLVPPYSVAVEARDWLKSHARDAILARKFA